MCAMSRPMRFLCVIGCWKIIEHNHIGWWDRIEIRIKACTITELAAIGKSER